METQFFNVDSRLLSISDRAEMAAKEAFASIDRITEFNQQKVLSAYIRHRVSETHFNPTTGYGYGDQGRDALDEILADIMGAEDALIRHSIVSGTHAITIALFGVLRPGDTLLAATGAPYDTLEKVIGHKEPVTNWKITLRGFVHPHFCIKTHRRVFSVYIQFHPCREL